MKLIYGVNDRPKSGQMIVFAIQQLLAIMAATIAVPAIVGNGMTAAPALFGAGVGTLVYQLFTKFKSPVFLGSSFAFIGSMVAAFAGATSAYLGFLGLILGAAFAGLVYVVLAIIIKLAGVNWINKLMPPAVIGSTVALIGLSLASASINDVFSYGAKDGNGAFIMGGAQWTSLACALVTLIVVICCSVYGKKMTKLIPFILGILAGVGTVGYSGYIKKANQAADNQLVAALNYAYAAACLENGVDATTTTAANITVGSDKKVGETDIAVSNPAAKADDIKAAFAKYYAGNENAEFKVATKLTFANGMFVADFAAGATKAVTIGGKTFYLQ